MQKGKGVLVGKCPNCGELIAIDLINSTVEGGKFEPVCDDEHEHVFITCPGCGLREEEPSLMTNI